jgi:integrase
MARLHKVGRVWYAAYYQEGRRIRRSTRCTDKKAAERVAIRWERLAADPRNAAAEATTLGEAFNMMLRDRKNRGRADGTIDMHASKAGHFIRLWGGDLQLSRVDAALVDDFTAIRIAEGTSRHTIAKELVTLRVTLKLARRRGEYNRHPDDVLPIAWETGYTPRQTALTAPQVDALLEHCAPHVANWVCFIVSTGARYGAALRALPGDLDVEAGLCRVRGSKTEAAARIVPVVPWVRQYASAVVLPLYPFTDSGLRKALGVGCEAAGVPRVTANDLRRTAGMLLREEIGDASLVGTYLGHTGSAMAMKVYAKLDGERLGRAIAKRSDTSQPDEGGNAADIESSGGRSDD